MVQVFLLADSRAYGSFELNTGMTGNFSKRLATILYHHCFDTPRALNVDEIANMFSLVFNPPTEKKTVLAIFGCSLRDILKIDHIPTVSKACPFYFKRCHVKIST